LNGDKVKNKKIRKTPMARQRTHQKTAGDWGRRVGKKKTNRVVQLKKKNAERGPHSDWGATKKPSGGEKNMAGFKKERLGEIQKKTQIKGKKRQDKGPARLKGMENTLRAWTDVEKCTEDSLGSRSGNTHQKKGGKAVTTKGKTHRKNGGHSESKGCKTPCKYVGGGAIQKRNSQCEKH